MTNGWIDIKNTDMMLVIGGNPAENHPCGFKWVIEAKRNRNAKLIVVDPRFNRTASNADLFLQIRAGTDIAFLGGMLNYAIQNHRIAKDYLVNYTNAAFIIKDGFKLPEDGLFSGFDENTHIYDKSSWNYQQGGNLTPTGALIAAALGGAAGRSASANVSQGQQKTGSASNAFEQKAPPAQGSRAAGSGAAQAAVGGHGPSGGGHQAGG